MKIYCQLLVALTFLGASTRVAHSANDDPYRLVYAKRQMSRLDKDRNGSFEASEDKRQWEIKKRFDSDSDGVLTVDELAKCQIRHLASSGEKKLSVLYKSTPEEDLYLDIYYPAKRGEGKLPTVIYTHGGGWAAGSKEGIAVGSHADLYTALLEKGFCVVAVNYRLYTQGGTVSMRDCVVDCKDAARYLSKHSDPLGVDPQRFLVQGDSAGGQLAQMLLLTPPESLPGDPELSKYSYQMLAGVSWYGPCDFEKTELFNHDGRARFRDRFGPRILELDSDPKDKLRLYREISPVNYLRADSPPLLMIQGDKDTTIPVHHARYMKVRADASGAPVETMIIKNAGHNWRQVDVPISPGRDEIVKKSVEFLTRYAEILPSATTTSINTTQPINTPVSRYSLVSTSASDAGRMPAFSWDTLPLYVHVRKAEAFTPQEVNYLAGFPLITFEKTTGSRAFGSTDAGTIQAAKAVKKVDPSTKTIYYRNVIVHYSGYSFDNQLADIPGAFLVNKAGNDKLVRGRVKAYDLSSEPLRKWWVDSLVATGNHEAIDGVMLDGNIKVLSTYLKRELPAGKKEAVVNGFHKMMQESRHRLDEDKLIIANILRARFPKGGLEYMKYFDGSYLEGFEHNVGRVSKQDYIAKGIRTVQAAAS